MAGPGKKTHLSLTGLQQAVSLLQKSWSRFDVEAPSVRSVEKYFLKDETLLRVRHAIPTPKWGMYSKHPHGRGSIGVGFSSISHPSSPTSTQRQPLQFRTPRE